MEECSTLVSHINKLMEADSNASIDLKEPVLKACANIFIRYFCSGSRFSYDDQKFSCYCKAFDEVFWEVNNGRAVDFLPWLMPFFQHSSAMKTMKRNSQKVRQFVEEEIIERKRSTRKTSLSGNNCGTTTNNKENFSDFLDTIMTYIDSKHKEGEESSEYSEKMTFLAAMYALEDILGGSFAVGNISLRGIYDLAKPNNEWALKELKKQLANCTGHFQPSSGMNMISLEDKKELHWVTAAMHETIRMTCSPIVPHTASQDSTIAGKARLDTETKKSIYFQFSGFKVPKDTVVFINNHTMSMSEELWNEPNTYKPDRFLDDETEEFFKPHHFQPFSMGRRSCMGYKMVHYITYSIKANLLKHFDISKPQTEDIPLGMLALPPKPFEFVMSKSASNNDTLSEPVIEVVTGA